MLAQAENIKIVISICLFRHFIFNDGTQKHLLQKTETEELWSLIPKESEFNLIAHVCRRTLAFSYS